MLPFCSLCLPTGSWSLLAGRRARIPADSAKSGADEQARKQDRAHDGAYAAEVVTWRYPVPYDCYDMTAADPGFLAGPGSGFFALTDEFGLIGFRSFGPDGQVPGGVYGDSALDTGGGLRPDLTGEGKGREAIQSGLDFGRQQFAPAAFRVTIATFNIRAQRVVAALGFRNIGSFRASTDGRSYEKLIKLEPAP